VQDSRSVSRITLAGPARWVAAIACFIPVALGFFLPAGYLLHEVIVRGLLVGFDIALVRYALTTAALAAIATAVTLLLGFSAVAALRYVKHPAVATCVNVAGVGYAVPGTVLALGLLSPLVLADEAVNGLILAVGGRGVGLILAGSAAALVIVYVIRFLAIAIGFAQAAFARISMELDTSSRPAAASSRARSRPSSSSPSASYRSFASRVMPMRHGTRSGPSGRKSHKKGAAAPGATEIAAFAAAR
jgi:iron(III) transport system permease protein